MFETKFENKWQLNASKCNQGLRIPEFSTNLTRSEILVTTQNKRYRRPRWHISQFKVEEVEGKVRFHDLFLPIALMRAIQEVGYEYASPIQAMTLPYSLAGYDLIGKAQTGTGKTAAFLITVITDLLEHRLEEQYSGEPRALILAPTRELALQIAEDATALTKFSRLKVVSAVGGMDLEKQQKQLAEQRCDILVATPGRLIDLMNRKSVFLDQIELLVIDEADRMLDMGFIPDIKTIVRAAPRNENRQTLMFSATFSPDILNLVDRWTNDPVRVEVEPKIKTSDDVEQHVYLVSADEKYQVLKRIVSEEEADRVMVFANRRDIVRDLAEKLKADGINCQVLSGEVPQNKRVRTLDGFKEGKFSVLVATDVAGRGIHIDGVSHVVNYTLPEDAEDYVHRIGRTGRAGKKGVSISFACEDDSFQIPAIEEYIKAKINVEQVPAAWVSDEAFIDAIAQRKLDAEEAEATAAVEAESAGEVAETVTTEDNSAEQNNAAADEVVGEISSIEIAETEEGPEIEVEVTVVEDEIEGDAVEAEQAELALESAEAANNAEESSSKNA
ncbi:ATP-dependent RNA helicase RhlB [Reinekea marina]|uniref:ATP-dependent RNA helicase RhlB n=1 Tax=Reinekea marina TaxID=1310421 RepID=UPI0025B47EA8|nr:ATP-dependent RNA helicase RhlB [Reinekea marina]MDN3650221.1 ATP-dependent RNA helicase RhlB [Reinekea marina]